MNCTSGRLWLIAGTGEGPRLAAALLACGWELTVSVVSQAAGRAYPRHPLLQLEVGAIEGSAGIQRRLGAARLQQRPYQCVIDASHPFAVQISAQLAETCGPLGQPLLRLLRPLEPPLAPRQTLLNNLQELAGKDLDGQRLLLAIGARQLATAAAHASGAELFARVLPTAASLQQARAAGLPDAHLACLRPAGAGAGAGAGAAAAALGIEQALLRQWGITAVLCRQSGGSTERGWQQLCVARNLRLLLLARPAEPVGVEGLPLPGLLEKLGQPPSRL
ncbi:precorrin-6A/cobalt-precorrin-6A reductase [Synechococcus sp. ATX 2A4]|uniref:precorrin-6A/cobalt-precorrin-6A reductase n=1 Tax=Synechococcus sp. ATX 2A4 TaxID=2823727 RepID=UPI0020CDEA73|nr:precorrin-6A/cobalt-precorrin-6A reductase [Synechococcus sp. ATX 2A4]MCP9883949.1 precorrin-6A/cobalt-precorrin-6A reductase [Synechococcus sp. ATX 2A4]